MDAPANRDGAATTAAKRFAYLTATTTAFVQTEFVNAIKDIKENTAGNNNHYSLAYNTNNTNNANNKTKKNNKNSNNNNNNNANNKTNKDNKNSNNNNNANNNTKKDNNI